MEQEPRVLPKHVESERLEQPATDALVRLFWPRYVRDGAWILRLMRSVLSTCEGSKEREAGNRVFGQMIGV